MRIAILGNSGSGKSTLARWLAEQSRAGLLDLDTVAWEPDQVLRTPEAAAADVRHFCSNQENWIVEGCYRSLVNAALGYHPLLLFMNPGEEVCLSNCRARPWEKHKYASKEQQDERLAFLLSWVSDYYRRDGDMSLKQHRACFDAYGGAKEELSIQPELNAPTPRIQAWLKGSAS
jgi:adenylate kinase family enzyme